MRGKEAGKGKEERTSMACKCKRFRDAARKTSCMKAQI